MVLDDKMTAIPRNWHIQVRTKIGMSHGMSTSLVVKAPSQLLAKKVALNKLRVGKFKNYNEACWIFDKIEDLNALNAETANDNGESNG